MKTSDNVEFSVAGASTTSFKSLSGQEIRMLLAPLYVSLDAEARRARFGCAVSDASIVRHCRGLDLKQVVVLGCIGPSGLIAAIELHPMSSTWEEVELAVADRAGDDRILILGHLLQLAAFAAGQRACTTLVVEWERPDHGLLRLLRSLGRVRQHDSGAHVDVAEYARLLERPL